jgi:hypothetical protein
MTDTLETQIRILVTELMDSAPQAPSVHDIELLEARRGVKLEPPVVDDETGRLRRGPRRLRFAAVVAVAAVVVVIAGLLVVGGNSTPQGRTTNVQTGTWKLMDDPLSGTWQLNPTGGPPPGSLSCPTPAICYAMSGNYNSPSIDAPLLSESLYASSDAGSTWSTLPMPDGFAPTSEIACGGASDCVAGGTYNGKPVLVTTNDGGHSFAIAPLPVGVGHLDTLTCTSTDFCAGLAAPSEYLEFTPTDATFLSTADGGKTFTDTPILTGDSMQSLACTSNLDCSAVGWSDALGANHITDGVAARTTDGGQSWTAGTLPAGLGISYQSKLACGDAQHCSVSGIIAITVTNPSPPYCLNHTQPEAPGATTTPPTIPTSVQGPAVAAISQLESGLATNQVLKLAQSGQQLPCNGPRTQTSFVSDLASTTDGGLSWSPDALPTNVPEPMISHLSCPTENECWAAGSYLQPEQVGPTLFGASEVLLGTTTGGSTWSTVTFNIPNSVQTYNARAYGGIGSIDCPSAGVCVALGLGTQSAPSVPTFSLVVPGSN